MTWTCRDLARTIDGSWLVEPRGDHRITGASLDTRTLSRGQAFLAFTGTQTDGHRYLEQAAAAGASIALVEREVPRIEGLPTLRVESTERALVQWARAQRARLDAQAIIGVTGSVGKTTTTRLLHAALSAEHACCASIKSYNNRLGVSLTLLNAPDGLDELICEMGMNAAGEMGELVDIVRPTIGVVTAIGRAHIEALGSVEAIAREKGTMYASPALELAVGPSGTPLLEPHWPAAPRVLVGEHPVADVRVVEIAESPAGVSFTLGDGARFRIPLAGRHNALNAAIAVAVARARGLGDESIARGLASAAAAEHRLAIRSVGPITIIDDAYNASPESMHAALDALVAMPTVGRRIAILGEMRELGGHSEAIHREIGQRLARERTIDRCVLLGPAMAAAAEASGSFHLPGLDDDAIARACAGVEPGDVVLVKASRGVRLERVVDRLCERFGAMPAVATLGESSRT